jgi:hypothetical protein
MADALGRASVRRGPLCAAAPPMRVRVCTRAGARLRGALGVDTAAWKGGSITAFECVYIGVCVCCTLRHTLSRESVGLCVRAPVCDGDGSAVCARAGGLVLRARPEPETLNRASPCPSASTACGFGSQAFSYASAFNANIGAWNTASVSTLAEVSAYSARGRALWRTRSAGLRCDAARCARRHRRFARACAHVQALACAGPWV